MRLHCEKTHLSRIFFFCGRRRRLRVLDGCCRRRRRRLRVFDGRRLRVLDGRRLQVLDGRRRLSDHHRVCFSVLIRYPDLFAVCCHNDGFIREDIQCSWCWRWCVLREWWWRCRTEFERVIVLFLVSGG